MLVHAGSNPAVPATLSNYANSEVGYHQVSRVIIWPYEEYTLLENLLVVAIPYLLALIFYYLIWPRISRKEPRKKAEMESLNEAYVVADSNLVVPATR